MIWEGRTLVDSGEGAEGCAVDDDGIITHHRGIEIVVGDDAFTTAAGDGEWLDAELTKGVLYCKRCSASAEYKGMGVMGLEERTDGFAEPYDIGVETAHVAYANDIDSSDGFGIGVKTVQQRNDILLVGDGNVQTDEFGCRSYQLHYTVGRRHLVVVILCIKALTSELVREVLTRKRMTKGLAYKSVFIHNGMGLEVSGVQATHVERQIFVFDLGVACLTELGRHLVALRYSLHGPWQV